MAKYIRKILCILMIALCICSIGINTYAQEINFKDVTESRWYYKDLVAMYNKGIISGFSDLTFRATQNLTENQLIKMIAVALNENKKYTEKGKFWIYPYIKNAVEMGIIDSTDYIENSYNNPIAREDVAFMIDKAIKIGLIEPIEDKNIEEFDIKEKIKDYEIIKEDNREAVVSLYKLGIVVGDKSGNFNPRSSLTRAEATAILNRLVTKREALIKEKKIDTGKINGYVNIDGTVNVVTKDDTPVKAEPKTEPDKVVSSSGGGSSGGGSSGGGSSGGGSSGGGSSGGSTPTQPPTPSTPPAPPVTYPTRGLFIGNSFLLGFSTHGMASTNVDTDYYYYINKIIKENKPTYVSDRVSGAGLENATTSQEGLNWVNNVLSAKMNNRPDFVVIQLGENVNTAAKKTAFETCARLIVYYLSDLCPGAKVVWITTTSDTEVKEKIISACALKDVTFIDASSVMQNPINKSYVGSYYISNTGALKQFNSSLAPYQPNDLGMVAMANKVCHALGYTASEDTIKLKDRTKDIDNYIKEIHDLTKVADVEKKTEEYSNILKVNIFNKTNNDYITNATGKVYYVSNSGNDSNSGLTKENPIATFTKLESLNLQPGDVVLFERGSEWRGGNFRLHKGVTYSTYGVGTKPLFMASPENGADSTKWTLVGGTTNIWKYYKPMIDCGNIIIDDGERWGYKVLPNHTQATGFETPTYDRNYAFFSEIPFNGGNYPNGNTAEGNLYMRCDQGNPGAIFNSIEFAIHRHVFVLYNSSSNEDGNNITIDNLAIKYAGNHGISTSAQSHLKPIDKTAIKNCDIEWIGGSTQIYNEDGSCTRFGNGIEFWGAAQNALVESCYFNQIYDAALTYQYSGTDDDLSYNNMKFIRNIMENSTYSIEIFNHGTDGHRSGTMKNITIDSNMFLRSGYGWGNQRKDKTAQTVLQLWFCDHEGTENFNVTNNLFYLSANKMISSKFPLTFTGNTFVKSKDDASSFGYYSYLDTNFNQDRKYTSSNTISFYVKEYLKDLTAKCFESAKTCPADVEVPIKILNPDFSDFSLWKSGYYPEGSVATANAGRICLKELLAVEGLTKFTLTLEDTNYKYIIRELDASKKYIKSYYGVDNNSFVTNLYTRYLAISIYNPTDAGVGLDTYQLLFEDGMKVGLINGGIVIVQETSLAIPEEEMQLYVGWSKVLGFTITPSNASYMEVTYTSSDPSIVEIIDNKYARAVAVGTSTITVRTHGGIEKTCSVTVIADDSATEHSLASYIGNVTATSSPTLVDRGVSNTKRYPNSNSSYKFSRNPWDLKRFDNKIFIGAGDYDINSGPVTIFYYNPLNDAIETSGEVVDEQVERFVEIDGELFAPGIDPRPGGHGYVYKYNGTTWDIAVDIGGGIHDWDYTKYHGKYYVGTANGAATKATIMSSTDGTTFSPVQCYLTLEDANAGNNLTKKFGSGAADYMRAYELIVLNDKLYTYISNYDGIIGVYEYDETNNWFLRMPYGYGNTSGNPKGIDEYFIYRGRPVCYTYFSVEKKEVFNNKLVYTNFGRLRSTTDMKQFSDIIVGSSDYYVTDLLISDDTLFVLAFIKNADGTYTSKLYRTKDLTNFVEVFNFNTTGFLKTMEYIKGKMVFGVGCAKEVPTNEVGRIYTVDVTSIVNN